MTNSSLKTNPEVSPILRQLMKAAGIKEAELARQVNLPQTTINRLVLGGTADPRAYTLKPIADYFNITIGQLCGFELLSPYHIEGIVNPNLRTAWTNIPILEWEQVNAWHFNKKSITPLTHSKWIASEKNLSLDSFALYSLPSMEPRFREGSILVIDPQANYKDGHFIIIAFDGIHPTVRRVIRDGGDIFLKQLDQTSQIKLEKQHRIFGTIIESRLNIYDI